MRASYGSAGRSYRVFDSRLMGEYQINLPFHEDGIILLTYLVFGFIQTVENFTFSEEDGIGTI